MTAGRERTCEVERPARRGAVCACAFVRVRRGLERVRHHAVHELIVCVAIVVFELDRAFRKDQVLFE